MFLAFFVAAVGFVHGQPVQTGGVSGRIYSPATQEYIQNAEVRVQSRDREQTTYSEADGSFRVSGLAAGEATLRVVYTGYESMTATVSIAQGQTAQRDFELALQKTPGSTQGSVVLLEKMMVSTEREGNAKAIMTQRAALNAKNVVASDKFGYIGEGNVGEFLRFVPGVVMDYVESEARSPRISGMDPKYATVTLDGSRVASTNAGNFNNNSRQFDFDQISISSIASIEVNKTLTADMDGDAPAGAIRLVSKSGFDRKGRDLTYQFDTTANSYSLTLGRETVNDGGPRRSVLPGGRLGYSDVFLQGRLGVNFSANLARALTFERWVRNTYDYSNAARGPVLTQITWQDSPKFTQRSSMALNLDYKLSSRVVLSLRNQYGRFDDNYAPSGFMLRANPANIDPASTLTTVIANATPNANTRLDKSAAVHLNKIGNTLSLAPKLEVKGDTYKLTGGVSYSRARVDFQDMSQGYFAVVDSWLTRMSWRAERSAANQSAWHITQLSGPDWHNFDNYNRSDVQSNNVGSRYRGSKHQEFAGTIDLVKTVPIAGRIFEIKTGAKSRLSVFDRSQRTLNWTYVGPTGNQLDPRASLTPFLSAYQADPKQGGNMFASPSIPTVDRAAVYHAFAANPAYFAENTFANYSNVLLNNSDIKEQIDAGYFALRTSLQRLRLEAGVRYERTRNVGKVYNPRRDAEVLAAGYTANTIPFLLYKYHDGVRDNSYNRYDNWFFSGGGKYKLTSNLDAQFGASQAILRPDYTNLAGAVDINETARTVNTPNRNLKPETSVKYYSGLQYYFEPAGNISIGAFVLDVQNLQERTFVSAETAGYANDPNFSDFTFNTTVNNPNRRRNVGIEAEFTQQLVFLPRPFDGLTAFAALTRIIADAPRQSLVPKAVSGGIGYRLGRFQSQIRSTWTSARINAVAANNELRWQTERMLVDASASWKFSDKIEAFVSGRNIFNEPLVFYSNEPGRLFHHEQFGIQWTFGIRGRF